MPKQPPNDVLAMRKVGLGFARFAADVETTSERHSRREKGWGEFTRFAADAETTTEWLPPREKTHSGSSKQAAPL